MNKISSNLALFGMLMSSAVRQMLVYNRLFLLATLAMMVVLIINVIASDASILFKAGFILLVSLGMIDWIVVLPKTKAWIGLPPRA